MKFISLMFFALILSSTFLGITVEVKAVNEFEFGTDTFNFKNNFSKRALSVDEAYDALKLAEWTTSFPDWAVKLLANLVVALHKDSGGNCWGMSYTAKYYYDNPELFKANYPGYSNLNAVPLDLIAPEIIRNQWLSVFINQTVLYNCILFQAKFPVIEEQIPHIQSQLDNNSPELIMFDTFYPDYPDQNGSHAVLAYNYSINDKNNGQYSEFLLGIYDPNDYEKSQVLNFSISQTSQYILEESALTEKYNLTNLSCATFAEPDWEFILENRGELIEGILDLLEVEDLLPMEEIFMAAIVIISILVILFIVLAIVIITIIKKMK